MIRLLSITILIFSSFTIIITDKTNALDCALPELSEVIEESEVIVKGRVIRSEGYRTNPQKYGKHEVWYFVEVEKSWKVDVPSEIIVVFNNYWGDGYLNDSAFISFLNVDSEGNYYENLCGYPITYQEYNLEEFNKLEKELDSKFENNSPLEISSNFKLIIFVQIIIISSISIILIFIISSKRRSSNIMR